MCLSVSNNRPDRFVIRGSQCHELVCSQSRHSIDIITNYTDMSWSNCVDLISTNNCNRRQKWQIRITFT